MSTDDFDVELERAELQVKRPVTESRAAPANATVSQPAAPQGSGSDAGPSGTSRRPQRAVAMSSRRPGPFARAGESIARVIGQLRLPKFDATSILYGLLTLIIFALLAENWAPVRINLFGLYVDVPKAVAFVVNVGIGMLVLLLIQRCRRVRSAETSEGGQS